MEEGSALPRVDDEITYRRVIMNPATTWDHFPGHHDPEYARSQGQPTMSCVARDRDPRAAGPGAAGAGLSRLVDEYRFTVFPTLLGDGKRMFGETPAATP